MKIPADKVKTGRVMLLNGERWDIAEMNIKPATMTFFLRKDGAHVTLTVPRDYEVEVLDEFYVGRTLTLWGRTWQIVHPDEHQHETWISLTTDDAELALTTELLRKEMA